MENIHVRLDDFTKEYHPLPFLEFRKEPSLERLLNLRLESGIPVEADEMVHSLSFGGAEAVSHVDFIFWQRDVE
jgi:hypothetical protein